jgi:hypothetical protein
VIDHNEIVDALYPQPAFRHIERNSVQRIGLRRPRLTRWLDESTVRAGGSHDFVGRRQLLLRDLDPEPSAQVAVFEANCVVLRIAILQHRTHLGGQLLLDAVAR